MIFKPNNYVSSEEIVKKGNNTSVRGQKIRWESFKRLQSSGKIAVCLASNITDQLIPQQKVFPKDIRMLLVIYRAINGVSMLTFLAGWFLTQAYDSLWFLWLVVIGSYLFGMNQNNLHKKLDYALWTNKFFYQDCQKYLDEAFEFYIDRDFKKNVVDELDAIKVNRAN